MDLGAKKSDVNSRLSLTHYALGINCFNEKDYEGAKIEFSRSIDYCDRIPEVFVNRARACVELGQMKNAFSDLDKTLVLSPNHEMAHSLLQRFNRAPKPQFEVSVSVLTLSGGKI